MGSGCRSAVIVCLFWWAHTADAALTFSFGVRYFQSNGGQASWGFDVLPARSADITSYAYSSPAGQYSGSSTVAAPHEDFLNSFAAVRDAVSNSGPWTLTAVSGGVTSTYHFTPNLNGLTEGDFPLGQLISPTPGQTTGTFQIRWGAASGIATSGYVQINEDTAKPGGFFNSLGLQGGGAGTWFPGKLSTGTPTNYVANLGYFGPTSIVPVSPELVSGPDIGLAATSSVSIESETFTKFTAIPEPASLGLILLALTPIAGRRVRCR
jgi:hypothetical protein